MAFEFRLPDVGEGVVEGEIVEWFVAVGDEVEEDQPLAEVMTDKATVEISSPVAGRIQERRGEEGEIVDVGEILVVIDTGKEDDPTPEPTDTKLELEEAVPTSESRKEAELPVRDSGKEVLATPAVRKQARDGGIDLNQVQGTGPGGRITSEDLEKFVASQQKTEDFQPAEQELERLPYRGLRRKIGSRLSESVRKAVHYSYVEEADVTGLVELRSQAARRTEAEHLTYLPFIFKAVVSGLKQYPELNSTLDEEANQIVLKKRYHIGIATATDEGLIVPVVRDADKKSILELSEEISALVERARKGSSRLDELKGGTFTITSLGPLGGISATPIINYPEVAILGVHKIVKRPVVRSDQVVIRQMMNLSISLDHRVIDGMIAARFIHHVIGILESPGLLLFD